MPQYGIKYRVGWKSGDMESSIIKCVISVIQIHSWIGPTYQKRRISKEKYDDI